jgi:hypothetical protein
LAFDFFDDLNPFKRKPKSEDYDPLSKESQEEYIQSFDEFLKPSPISAPQHIPNEIIEKYLLNPNSKHRGIYTKLQEHKELLRLFLELPESYKEANILDMIETQSYYANITRVEYLVVSFIMPITRKDIIVRTLELVYNDFSLVLDLPRENSF